VKYPRICTLRLSFDVFFPGDTRPGSAARAGTLTYIHTYVSKPMSTTVDRAIASFVRWRLLGLATGRPDLIFSKLRSLGRRRRPPVALHFALAFTLRIIEPPHHRTCCAPLRRALAFLVLKSDSNGSCASKCEADALGGTLGAKAFALNGDKIELRHRRRLPNLSGSLERRKSSTPFCSSHLTPSRIYKYCFIRCAREAWS